MTDPGKDSCQGDSGGPLICLEDGIAVLYGVVSWGKNCAREGSPGIYANIFKLKEWIQKTMEPPIGEIIILPEIPLEPTILVNNNMFENGPDHGLRKYFLPNFNKSFFLFFKFFIFTTLGQILYQFQAHVA